MSDEDRPEHAPVIIGRFRCLECGRVGAVVRDAEIDEPDIRCLCGGRCEPTSDHSGGA